jgi:hypothetical protein
MEAQTINPCRSRKVCKFPTPDNGLDRVALAIYCQSIARLTNYSHRSEMEICKKYPFSRVFVGSQTMCMRPKICRRMQDCLSKSVHLSASMCITWACDSTQFVQVRQSPMRLDEVDEVRWDPTGSTYYIPLTKSAMVFLCTIFQLSPIRSGRGGVTPSKLRAT